MLQKLQTVTAALQDIIEHKAQLEAEIWRVDHTTRLGIFQSCQMPVHPSLHEILAAVHEATVRQTDDSWVKHRDLTEVELFHDVVSDLVMLLACLFLLASCTCTEVYQSLRVWHSSLWPPSSDPCSRRPVQPDFCVNIDVLLSNTCFTHLKSNKTLQFNRK
jgi:hypothetical protein